MTLLIIGILGWIGVHFLKRLAPAVRSGLATTVGSGPDKGVIAGLLVVSLILMILGYRSAEFTPIYTPMAGMGHLNNLLMFVAVVLMGAGSSKGKMRSWMRHPMLTGVLVWSGAHLLVNGDKASLVLFGSMAVWAVLQMVLINRGEGAWTRPEPGPAKSDVKLLVISLVLFVIITTIHVALGRNPFLGTYG